MIFSEERDALYEALDEKDPFIFFLFFFSMPTFLTFTAIEKKKDLQSAVVFYVYVCGFNGNGGGEYRLFLIF